MFHNYEIMSENMTDHLYVVQEVL